MRVAISGAGIAGPTLAYWLVRAGWRPTLIEAAPALRTGGYMVDFWGVGFDVAERMGILPQVRTAGYDLADARWVDARGRTVARVSNDTLRRELGDRLTSLPRGELAAIVFGALDGRVEALFGVRIVQMEEHAAGVRVRLSDGSARDFDLVVGADGLHSGVRALAFGDDADVERSLGYYVAAFEAPGYRPRDELAYVSYGLPGRQISRFAGRGDATMFLFVFDAARLGGPEPASPEWRKTAVARVFDGAGWEWPQIAKALAHAQDVYFDRVSQTVTPHWSKGRVALVGDAAAAVSLTAGEGCGLGMTEAYVLAGELARAPDHVAAFARYEARLRPFIDGKQKAARAFATSFAPKTALGVWLRNQAVRLMALPGLPGLLIGPQMRDDFDVPDYKLSSAIGSKVG
jgi:2-polyprenyl-6-methoxyphenol hydroxylase-like FAD-dependent oxidoreductase